MRIITVRRLLSIIIAWSSNIPPEYKIIIYERLLNINEYNADNGQNVYYTCNVLYRGQWILSCDVNDMQHNI